MAFFHFSPVTFGETIVLVQHARNVSSQEEREERRQKNGSREQRLFFVSFSSCVSPLISFPKAKHEGRKRTLEVPISCRMASSVAGTRDSPIGVLKCALLSPNKESF